MLSKTHVATQQSIPREAWGGVMWERTRRWGGGSGGQRGVNRPGCSSQTFQASLHRPLGAQGLSLHLWSVEDRLNCPFHLLSLILFPHFQDSWYKLTIIFEIFLKSSFFLPLFFPPSLSSLPSPLFPSFSSLPFLLLFLPFLLPPSLSPCFLLIRIGNKYMLYKHKQYKHVHWGKQFSLPPVPQPPNLPSRKQHPCLASCPCFRSEWSRIYKHMHGLSLSPFSLPNDSSAHSECSALHFCNTTWSFFTSTWGVSCLFIFVQLQKFHVLGVPSNRIGALSMGV